MEGMKHLANRSNTCPMAAIGIIGRDDTSSAMPAGPELGVAIPYWRRCWLRASLVHPIHREWLLPM
eukprot:12915366-Prorocentrum_lima.AAC.1